VTDASPHVEAQLHPLNFPVLHSPRFPPGRLYPSQFSASSHGPWKSGVHTELQKQPSKGPSRHRPCPPPFGSLNPPQVSQLSTGVLEQTLLQGQPIWSPAVHLPTPVLGLFKPSQPLALQGAGELQTWSSPSPIMSCPKVEPKVRRMQNKILKEDFIFSGWNEGESYLGNE
jgi:hypothetical protein